MTLPDPALVMVVFGTRPEAVKLAPLIRAMADTPWCRPRVTVTAQHREMLDQVLALFGIEPDHDLDILRPGQTLTDISLRALAGLSPLVEAERPAAVVVQGDTTTTFIGALAAFYHRVPVVHVEAGLRTDNPYSPYPEEINRRLTTQLTSLHLAATPQSRANLTRDGIDPERIAVTGNTVIDALRWAVEQRAPYGDERLDRVDASGRQVLLVTAHRREAWAEGMRSIGLALADVAEAEPELEVVFPIHRNPIVRDAILPAIEDRPNVTVLEPLAYGAFARLMNRATVVLTDSGGVQEEAPSLGKPVLVMRDTTERPEAVSAGTAKLVGTRRDAIVTEVLTLLRDKRAYARMANAVNPYGDGRAVERCLAAIGAELGFGERLTDFGG